MEPYGALMKTTTSTTAKAAENPNIVFILADNLGYGEIGCYGGGITARRADAAHRLARQGRHAPAQHEHGDPVHAQPSQAS